MLLTHKGHSVIVNKPVGWRSARLVVIALVVVAAALTGWHLLRPDGSDNVAYVYIVEGSAERTSLRLWQGDSCGGGDARVGIESQTSEEVVVFVRQPQVLMGCADGGGTRGTVEVDDVLADRRIVVLQPPAPESRGLRQPITCLIDGASSSNCHERVTGDPEPVFGSG